MPCDRCFELTTQKRETEFFHILVRELSDEEDEDGEFVVVPDDQLDLDQLLTETFCWICPASFSVRQTARALCPICGKNLNQGDCGCEKDTVDPRLAI